MSSTADSVPVVVVRESRAQRDGLFGFLTLAFAAALVRGATTASTAGRVGSVIVFGALLVAVLVGWFRVLRQPYRLDVSSDAIRLRRGGDQVTELLQANGSRLMFTTQGSGRAGVLRLTQVDSTQFLELRYFNQARVRQACQQGGWQL